MNKDGIPVMDFVEEYITVIESNDQDAINKARRRIPLTPGTAKTMKNLFGKQYIIERGYDLCLVNAELGDGWINEPDSDLDFLNK